jgi:hypothetical protein
MHFCDKSKNLIVTDTYVHKRDLGLLVIQSLKA